MTDLAWTLTQSGATVPATFVDRLDRLVSRIAVGDRTAFRDLFAFLAARVWHVAAAALPAGHAPAVTRSTFVTVWHTADTAARYDARDWIEGIAAAEVGERRRDTAADRGERDDSIRRELADVLGPGPATIRVGPAMFTRVGDLDGAIDAIATAARLTADQFWAETPAM